ncbi:MAG TPA: FAD-binding protein [bacterium]|nr:FAD-binding protein [bacterium]HPS28774.1 FAD-binding protein [bacterium]
MKLKKDAYLDRILTLKIRDAVCDLYFPESIDDIVRFSFENSDYRIISGGSNIIAGRVKKPVLFMGGMIGASGTEDVSENAVKTFMPAGAPVNKVINYSVKNGLSGLEFMAGIPGTVGGAICGNAAPAGCSWDDVCGSVYYVKDGAVSMFIPEFGYRTLLNAPESPYIIYGADLILVKDTPDNVRQRVLYYLSKRMRITKPSAGSLFKNPEVESAGSLLEKAGMKGFEINDACLSPKHANIVINKGDAVFDDFCRLKDEAQKRVLEMFNINLELEVKYWYE